MKSRHLTVLGSLVALATACVVPPSPGEPNAGSSGDPSEGSSTTHADPGSTSVGSSTTDGGTADSGGTGGSSGATETGDTEVGTTGDEPPQSVCDPQPEPAPSFLGLDFDEEDPFLGVGETIELDVACVVTGITPVESLVSILLDCEDAPHVLDIASLGPIDLAVGDAVRLRAHDSQPWHRNTFVVLERDGQVIVAGMNGDTLPEGGDWSPPDTFFAPLGVEVLSDVCRPEPLRDEEPEGGVNFIWMPPCYQEQRQALQLTSGDQSRVVYDAGRGSVDGLELSVGEARAHLNVECVDTPSAWYRFLVVRTR